MLWPSHGLYPSDEHRFFARLTGRMGRWMACEKARDGNVQFLAHFDSGIGSG